MEAARRRHRISDCRLLRSLFNPNRSLGFMSDWHLFRTDWLYHWRRRSGLRQDRDVDKMPKEMLIWHEQTYKRDIITDSRSDDRFGLKPENLTS